MCKTNNKYTIDLIWVAILDLDIPLKYMIFIYDGNFGTFSSLHTHLIYNEYSIDDIHHCLKLKSHGNWSWLKKVVWNWCEKSNMLFILVRHIYTTCNLTTCKVVSLLQNGVIYRWDSNTCIYYMSKIITISNKVIF